MKSRISSVKRYGFNRNDRLLNGNLANSRDTGPIGGCGNDVTFARRQSPYQSVFFHYADFLVGAAPDDSLVSCILRKDGSHKCKGILRMKGSFGNINLYRLNLNRIYSEKTFRFQTRTIYTHSSDNCFSYGKSCDKSIFIYSGDSLT